MSDRESFLAAIRATPRGGDVSLPALDDPPDAPSELGGDEDPVARFRAEAELVGTVVHAVADVEAVPDCVLAILRDEGASHIGLVEDLAVHAESIGRVLRGGGLVVTDYRDIASDRHRVGTLDATVTGCLAAVAATGAIVTSASVGRAAALIAPVHVCIVPRERVVPGLHALLTADALVGAGSLFALQAGPSRSADIEKTLILGVHGPVRVHVVIAG